MISTIKKNRLDISDEPLPVMSTAVSYLMSILYDENISIKQMSEELEQFPAIAARLFALSNSVWSGAVVPVTRLSDACARLGLVTVRTLSIALAVSNVFDPLKCQNFDTERYWITALLTTQGAGLMAKTLGLTEHISSWRSAGLLHNLGLLWLADNKPIETSRALEKKDNVPLVESMRQNMETDYCIAGANLADAWSLPLIFSSVMANHRHQDGAGEYSLVASAVGLSANMASNIYHDRDWSGDTTNRKSIAGLSTQDECSIYEQMLLNFESVNEMVASIGSMQQIVRN